MRFEKITEFIMSSDDGLTPEKLEKFIEAHQAGVSRLRRLGEEYEGNYEILTQKEKAEHKPDNRIVVNFAKYLTDTLNGFFIGKPVKMSHEDAKIDEKIQFFNKFNSMDDHNYELIKMSSKYGKCLELIYLDENSQVRIAKVSPENAFAIYDDGISKRQLYGVRYYVNDKNEMVGTFSSDTEIVSFSKTDKGIVFDEKREPHFFDGVPLYELYENEEQRGLYEGVETLINAYNKAISEKANDVDYFADAYMKILGVLLDDESIKRIKDNRIINLEGDEDIKNIIVEFMEKPNADETQENLINRLEKLIYHIAMVANINDENFGSSSGISLKYKLQSMSNLALVKERKLTALFNKRYKLFASVPNVGISEDSWVGINYQFTRNIPNNLKEESEIAKNLKGIVSDETLFKIISIISNAKEEIERLKEQDEELIPPRGE